VEFFLSATLPTSALVRVLRIRPYDPMVNTFGSISNGHVLLLCPDRRQQLNGAWQIGRRGREPPKGGRMCASHRTTVGRPYRIVIVSLLD